MVKSDYHCHLYLAHRYVQGLSVASPVGTLQFLLIARTWFKTTVCREVSWTFVPIPKV